MRLAEDQEDGDAARQTSEGKVKSGFDRTLLDAAPSESASAKKNENRIGKVGRRVCVGHLVGWGNGRAALCWQPYAFADPIPHEEERSLWVGYDGR